MGKELLQGSHEVVKDPMLEPKRQDTEYVKYDVDRMHLSVNRDSETFLNKRLSNTNPAPIKRSFTNRDKEK